MLFFLRKSRTVRTLRLLSRGEHVFRVSDSGWRSLFAGCRKAAPISLCFLSSGVCLKAVDADLCISTPQLCVDEISQRTAGDYAFDYISSAPWSALPLHKEPALY